MLWRSLYISLCIPVVIIHQKPPVSYLLAIEAVHVLAGNQALSCTGGQHVLLSFQDLELHKQDHDNNLWVAEANELTAVSVLSAAKTAASPCTAQLQAWCKISAAFLQQLQDRVRSLTATA